MEMWNSPFIVPVSVFAMVLGIVVASIIGDYKKRQLEFEERMAALAKGVALPQRAPEMSDYSAAGRLRRIGLVRRWGIVLVAAGIGIAFFFTTLSWVLRERDVLAGGASALIPFAIGVGLLIDARISRGENERLELGSGVGEVSLRG